MPMEAPTAEQLAAALAARIIHDAIGPANGVVSAFDMASDPAMSAMRDEALSLAEQGARALLENLVLARTIYGAGGAALSESELTAAAKGLFNGSRASLQLVIDPAAITVGSGRLLLGLLQITAGVMAAGGRVAAGLSGGERVLIEIEAIGPKPRLGVDLRLALGGEVPESGLASRWAPAYFLSLLARSRGGLIATRVGDRQVSIRATLDAP